MDNNKFFVIVSLCPHQTMQNVFFEEVSPAIENVSKEATSFFNGVSLNQLFTIRNGKILASIPSSHGLDVRCRNKPIMLPSMTQTTLIIIS